MTVFRDLNSINTSLSDGIGEVGDFSSIIAREIAIEFKSLSFGEEGGVAERIGIFMGVFPPEVAEEELDFEKVGISFEGGW